MGEPTWVAGAIENTWPWRVGRSIGRTIYACPPGSRYRQGEIVIGMMDSAEIAAHVVEVHNRALGVVPCADGSFVHDFQGQASCPACGFTGIRSDG